jgi:hypothetical protein
MVTQPTVVQNVQRFLQMLSRRVRAVPPFHRHIFLTEFTEQLVCVQRGHAGLNFTRAAAHEAELLAQRLCKRGQR